MSVVFPGDQLSTGGSKPSAVGGQDLGDEGILNTGRRYVPKVGDLVVGVVVGKTSEFFRVDIKAMSHAVLPTIAFNGATKRNRPNLQNGAVVYCRVTEAHKDLDTKLTCESPETNKGWSTNEVYLCHLTTGGEDPASEYSGCNCVVDVSLAHARALLSESAVLFDLLGKSIPYEITIGQNGRIWLQAGSAREVVMLRLSLLTSAKLSVVEQEVMIENLIHEFA